MLFYFSTRDRSRHGGSILLFIKSVFTCSLLFNGTANFEFIVLSVKCNTISIVNSDFAIGLFYRPPDSNASLLDTLFNTLYNLDVSVLSNLYLIGDFNIDCFCVNSYMYNKLMSVTSLLIRLKLLQNLQELPAIRQHL